MRLIRRLTELQEQHGHLSDEVLRDLARAENVPLHRLQELVSFYPHFRTTAPPPIEYAVCRDMVCWLNGTAESKQKAELLAASPDEGVRAVSCLGHCELAPACLIAEHPGTLGDVNNKAIWRHEETLPWRIDPYASPTERYGLFRELRAGDRNEAAARILAALKESGLRGMGGAGFPTSSKWEVVRHEPRAPKYVICNADESEPGTFKDRVILQDLPHLVIEGMLLAGLFTGAERGILFLRHEYAAWDCRHLDGALREARQAGLLGDHFDIEVFVSPGGYILGEETALLECLEDRRGEPRNKPPFPGTHGLFGQPTLVNNVETLAMVPGIVKRGPAWWKEQGKPGFAGLKFIALSGHIERPGVYEVPMGTTVRELIEMGGGVSGGRALKAFAPGGASSNWLPASRIDVPLDFAPLAKAGSMLGSGAVVVVAEGTDMLALATNVVRFFRNESCGKCVPCRVGSQKAVELLERVQAGQAERKELEVLPELGEALALTSICGLGQVALNPILSVMKHWPEET
jgi:NADH:ubiquinone oxidoreductase subunit F (NADH-binding)/NADH:ubiquinone oxidoreductase subunit E